MHEMNDALEYWPSPPPWGWFADDLDRLPHAAPTVNPASSPTLS
jgi:hypothetical protein